MILLSITDLPDEALWLKAEIPGNSGIAGNHCKKIYNWRVLLCLKHWNEMQGIAKEMTSFSDYKEGSATNEYLLSCAKAEDIASKVKAKLESVQAPTERAEKVDYLLNAYKVKKAGMAQQTLCQWCKLSICYDCWACQFPGTEKRKSRLQESKPFMMKIPII